MRVDGGNAPDANSTLIIRPSRGWTSINVRELWAYRELLYFFVWRDVKVRYKQTALGALWAIIQPFTLMVVFSLFLGRLAGITPIGVPYPLFAFAGLVPWTLASKGLSASSESLVAASNLIQKVYFPRLHLPVSALGSHLLDYGVAMAALFVMMAYFGFPITPRIVWVLPLTVLMLVVALAGGIWLSAANVRYRDIRQLVPFLVQLWLFASPIAYSVNLVPANWLWLYQLNPMAVIIEGFRWALLGLEPPPEVASILVSLLASLVVLLAGLAYFRRVERTFADVI
jgi:lipopolysaccharide transport system permease protein